MDRLLHVFDLEKSTPPVNQPGVLVLSGKQAWLRQYALKLLRPTSEMSDDDFSQIVLDGEVAQWPDLLDELTANSLFGGSSLKRLTMTNADVFVSANRERLETLFEKGFKRSVLYLSVEQWLGTTRLAKWVNQHAWRIECDIPTRLAGNKKVDDIARVVQWVRQRAFKSYGLKLAEPAVQLLLELTKTDFGRIEQELCKLSLYFKPNEDVPPERVQEIVGGWQMQTMFQVIDAAVDGQASKAFKLLDQLFQSGEHPLAMLGQLGWSIRRYAVALEIYDRGPRQPASAMLKQAIDQAGFFAFRGEVAAAEPRVRRLGRKRIGEIYNHLMVTDAALKGSHSSDDRGRLAIEKLVLWLAAPADSKS